jgi:hypothetical protein
VTTPSAPSTTASTISSTSSATKKACEEAAFVEAIDLPEASGAVWVEASFGLPAHIVVIGDSGTHGAFVVVDEGGTQLARGALPLDRAASDDLEGLARLGDLYYAITSGGQVRHWRRVAADRFDLVQPAYDVHPDMVCAKTNCNYDFEGLCLAAPADGCDGYAASKTRGELVCLELDEGRLRADPARTLAAGGPAMLSGCDIAPEGDLLYAGNNLFGGNAVTRFRGWRDPASARPEQLGRLGPGFCEAIAVGPRGAIYRFSDLAIAPSAAGKVSCPPPAR